MFPDALLHDAETFHAELRTKRMKLATAEDGTGGLIAALLTEIAGSSDVVERGFIACTDAAKMALLNVPEAMLAERGAISPQVAMAMAEGAFWRSRADVAVATTAIAEDATQGGSVIHIGVVYGNLAPMHRERRFTGASRSAIRLAAAATALDLVRAALRPSY